MVQVDLVLCYDANASPIRDIQRSGRTGRHREGRVIHIMAAGKEELNYKKQQLVRHPLLSPFASDGHDTPVYILISMQCMLTTSVLLQMKRFDSLSEGGLYFTGAAGCAGAAQAAASPGL